MNILGLCVLLASLSQVLSILTFEFGDNVGYVVYNAKGSIKPLQKETAVQIVYPRNLRLSYVKVTVDNIISTPKVDLDVDTNTVYIRYRLLQSSSSTYKILAKAVPEDESLPPSERRFADLNYENPAVRRFQNEDNEVFSHYYYDQQFIE